MAPPDIDLQVSDIGLDRLGDYKLLIHYSTGNPNIGVVDKPLNFDVLVTGMYRPRHDPEIVHIELVNRRFTLPARVVGLSIPLQWPHYIRGVQVWVTINPDKSIREISYKNNGKYIYLWGVEARDCFQILPWPGNSNDSARIFHFPWDYDYTVKNYGTFSLYEGMVKRNIERGILKYLPGGAHGEQDMLQAPVQVAVGKCSAQSNNVRYSLKYITYNGPRTVEGSIHFDQAAMDEKVLNFSLLLKIQRENYLEFWLQDGSVKRINFKFENLPWNLYEIPPYPVLYEHAYLKGKSLPLREGSYVIPDLGRYGFNNIASSIWIPNRWGVWVYDREDFEGGYFLFNRPIDNLHNEGWGDRISSIEVIPPR